MSNTTITPEVLKALGITPDEISDRVVAAAVEKLLDETWHDEDGEVRVGRTSLTKHLEASAQEAFGKELDRIANETVVPRIGEMLEALTFQETSKWGEPKAPPLSAREYFETLAREWLTAKVDTNGRTEAECRAQHSTFSGPARPRLEAMVSRHFAISVQIALEAAVKDLFSTVQGGLQGFIAATLNKAFSDLQQKVRLEVRP